MSSLPLNVKLELKHPFSMLFGEEENVTKVTNTSMMLKVGETYNLRIEFDPAFKDDFHIRTVDEVLSVSYEEHPHIVRPTYCHPKCIFLYRHSKAEADYKRSRSMLKYSLF